jgi:hypothetical protein
VPEPSAAAGGLVSATGLACCLAQCRTRQALGPPVAPAEPRGDGGDEQGAGEEGVEQDAEGDESTLLVLSLV